MEHHNLVVAHTYLSQADADLAKSVLDSAGIAAMTTADTAGRMRDHLAWSGAGFQLLVREEDAADARALLSVPEGEGTAEDEAEGNIDAPDSLRWKRIP
jgi:hypothetical protein